MNEVKHSKPIVYDIYKYLKENHIGKVNAIKGKDLSAKFNIGERDLREVINEIRTSQELEKIIGSGNKGYFICTDEDFDEVDKRLERHALSTLKVVWANRKKRSKDGQFKMKMGKYFSEVYESLGKPL